MIMCLWFLQRLRSKLFFSLCDKVRNTVQLRNQIEFIQSSDDKNVDLFEGIVESFEELESTSSGSGGNGNNWIIWVWGSQDYSSFLDNEKYIQLWEYIKEIQINMIFILVGDINKKALETSKYLFFYFFISSLK